MIADIKLEKYFKDKIAQYALSFAGFDTGNYVKLSMDVEIDTDKGTIEFIFKQSNDVIARCGPVDYEKIIKQYNGRILTLNFPEIGIPITFA